MHFKSLAIGLFVQQMVEAINKENNNAQHHWLCMRGIHQWLVDSPYKGPAMWELFQRQDAIMRMPCMALVVADGLAPDRCQVISNHHDDFEQALSSSSSSLFLSFLFLLFFSWHCFIKSILHKLSSTSAGDGVACYKCFQLENSQGVFLMR